MVSMSQTHLRRVETFVHLLDEYIGFVGDLPADVEFNGHFLLEDKINAAGKHMGLGPIFKRIEQWQSAHGGAFSVPCDASDELWDRIRKHFGDIEEKGYVCQINLTINRPHEIGSAMYPDLPLRGFRNNENFTSRQRQDLVAILREWQRAARTKAVEGEASAAATGSVGREPRVRRGVPKDEANIKARAYLLRNPAATVRELADGIGCSTGLVSKLPAWKAVQDRRKQEQQRKVKVVRLTPRLQGVVGVDDELNQLIAEQKADAELSPLETDPASDRLGAPRRAKMYRRP
jgi:hypothetical protein